MLEDLPPLVEAATGLAFTVEELGQCAQRTRIIQRAFNHLLGLDRKDDYPPRRYMEEPIKSGPCAGDKCDKKVWDVMLDRFYELNGWDRETGLQDEKCLTDLGLEDVAVKLKKAGKLK
jgi:aldehyde:ferredoxin oxidoreductase